MFQDDFDLDSLGGGDYLNCSDLDDVLGRMDGNEHTSTILLDINDDDELIDWQLAAED